MALVKVTRPRELRTLLVMKQRATRSKSQVTHLQVDHTCLHNPMVAQPPFQQQFATDTQNVANHPQQQVQDTFAIPPTPDSVPPQWAVDMHNSRLHLISWQFYGMAIMRYNAQIDHIEQRARCSARAFNARRKGNEPLIPLSQPIARHTVSPLPDAPVAGAPLILPPDFVPAPVVLPPAHPNFPATKAALRHLGAADLTALLAAYDCAPQEDVEAQRSAFARFIGVRL
ncbi:hypothetical protein B0H11DRAFT_2060325 [Mycena galericulata]|nr:hypothetical protein B0H11DRAFT_2060325 [Mycena galericulata]